MSEPEYKKPDSVKLFEYGVGICKNCAELTLAMVARVSQLGSKAMETIIELVDDFLNLHHPK